jgi:hypothetical protein
MFREELAEILAGEGVAVATRTGYRRLFRRFEAWWTHFGAEAGAENRYDNVNEDNLLLYMTFERKWKRTKYATLKSMQYALRHCLLVECGRDVFRIDRLGRETRNVRLERFMGTIKREDANHEKRVKFALTKHVLTEMEPFFQLNTSRDDVIMWTVLCVGVACLLRLSEVCVVKHESRESKLLRWEDLEMKEERGGRGMGRLHLHDTKTKCYGSDMKVSFYEDETSTCPVKAVRRWLSGSERNRRGREALFMMSDREPVRFSKLNRKVRDCMRELGYDMRNYRGWSVRRGGAMTLARAGVSDRVIRGLGRWRSWCYRMYLGLQEEEKRAAAAQVARSIRERREGGTGEEAEREIERWVTREEWVGERK